MWGMKDIAPILVIAGPTASGKSHLAERLAERTGAWILNGDSLQVYAQMPLLTAQPHPLLPHHKLYSVMSVQDNCTAALWCEMVTEVIEEGRAQNIPLIIVGGSGLYLKSLMEGLSPIPDVPPEIRESARLLCEEKGVLHIHSLLAPEDQVRLKPTDTQRVLRAFEVLRSSGKSLQYWQAQSPKPSPYSFVTVALMPPKSVLDSRIETRFREMVEGGAMEEVRGLLKLNLSPSALRAIGVRELQAYLVGEISLEEAIQKAVIASRQYAKRQLTWLRHQLVPDMVISEIPSKSAEDLVIERWFKK